MSRTETIRFKILNRLSGFTLIVNPVTGCWTKSNISPNIYSQVKFEGRLTGLHLLACIIFHNLDLDKPNQFPLHKCDIKACCNPKHLYVGSQSSNIKDDKFRQKHHIPDGVIIDRPKPIINLEDELEFIPDHLN